MDQPCGIRGDPRERQDVALAVTELWSVRNIDQQIISDNFEGHAVWEVGRACQRGWVQVKVKVKVKMLKLSFQGEIEVSQEKRRGGKMKSQT